MPGVLGGRARRRGHAGGRARPIVVPGGGAFADQVRSRPARRIGFSDDAAHWMAILAMDQAARSSSPTDCAGARLVDDAAGAIAARTRPALIPVLAPHAWMRAGRSPCRIHWDVTSDSIAAFVAGALGATRADPAQAASTDRWTTLVDAGLRARVPPGLAGARVLRRQRSGLSPRR